MGLADGETFYWTLEARDKKQDISIKIGFRLFEDKLLGIRDKKLETRDKKLETRDKKLETRCRKLSGINVGLRFFFKFVGPVEAVGRTEFPGGKTRFHILKHRVPLGRCS
jgi:hypothetical protein